MNSVCRICVASRQLTYVSMYIKYEYEYVVNGLLGLARPLYRKQCCSCWYGLSTVSLTSLRVFLRLYLKWNGQLMYQRYSILARSLVLYIGISYRALSEKAANNYSSTHKYWTQDCSRKIYWWVLQNMYEILHSLVIYRCPGEFRFCNCLRWIHQVDGRKSTA